VARAELVDLFLQPRDVLARLVKPFHKFLVPIECLRELAVGLTQPALQHYDGSGIVLVVDDDAAMRRWKARFVRSDYGSKSSPRLRISSAALTRTCLGA
jgi:hypothetical protein